MDGFIITELERFQFASTLDAINKVRVKALDMGGLNEENITEVISDWNNQAIDFSLNVTN